MVKGVKESELDGLARDDWKADTDRLGHTVSIITVDGEVKAVPCLDEVGFRRSVMEMVRGRSVFVGLLLLSSGFIICRTIFCMHIVSAFQKPFEISVFFFF